MTPAAFDDSLRFSIASTEGMAEGRKHLLQIQAGTKNTFSNFREFFPLSAPKKSGADFSLFVVFGVGFPMTATGKIGPIFLGKRPRERNTCASFFFYLRPFFEISDIFVRARRISPIYYYLAFFLRPAFLPYSPWRLYK